MPTYHTRKPYQHANKMSLHIVPINHTEHTGMLSLHIIPTVHPSHTGTLSLYIIPENQIGILIYYPCI